ncbi:MAG: Lrp/AsnC ligand binding domain-containing protein [Rhodocyclaceae bacterium]
MYKLDQIDIEILETLQREGRTTNVALAKQVGLSATPCLERVKGLEQAGIISGYAARLSAEELGLGLTVFIELTAERTSETAFADFREAILAIPEVQECYMMAGGFDYLLKVRVPDMSAYRRFLGEVLFQVPGIRETHTYPVMEEIKDTGTLSLRHLKRAE